MGGGVSGGETTEWRTAGSRPTEWIVIGGIATFKVPRDANPVGAHPVMARQLDRECLECESGAVGAQGSAAPWSIRPLWDMSLIVPALAADAV